MNILVTGGTGYIGSHTVLELIHAFEQVCGKKLEMQIAARRPGDVVSCYANASRARRELDWHTDKSIADAYAYADSWRWQSQNPDGYGSPKTLQ